jgi:hypothetical protein
VQLVRYSCVWLKFLGEHTADGKPGTVPSGMHTRCKDDTRCKDCKDDTVAWDSVWISPRSY